MSRRRRVKCVRKPIPLRLFFSPVTFSCLLLLNHMASFAHDMQKDKDGSTSVNFSFLEGKREWVALKMESARYCASRSTVITIRFSPAPPLGTPLSDQTHHQKKRGATKKTLAKKYENDKCIWPERAGTKLASSSTSLGHPQTYIYIGIYRRGREKKTDITFLSCVDTNIVLAPPLYKVKKRDR